MTLDTALLLSRWQFAFTISFHIIFPAFTIGLASYLAMLEFLWLRTGNDVFQRIYRFWLTIFAVSFGMGVVSGVVLSYEFGTNWARFSQAVGNVIGPLMAFEVMSAFFLEASFLGIMLFGWQKVGKKLHFFATCAVAVGTLISAFWIVSANSWMHTPAGYSIRDGIFYPEDWFAIVFNPSFPYRFAHMVAAAYLTTAFAVIGTAAWYLLQRVHVAPAKVMLSMGLWFALLFAPAQAVIGDYHGLEVGAMQPAKLAALEAHWETSGEVPLILFAWPDMKAEANRFEIAIPKLGSLILTHSWEGVVKGLKDFAPEDRPYAPIPFFGFRAMVGLGLLMIAVAVIGAALHRGGRVYTARWFLRLCVACTPIGFIAVLGGWFVAETGRQPYVVQGLMRTADAGSPLLAHQVATSLALFVIAYGIIFGAGIYYILKLVRRGPGAEPEEPVAAAMGAKLAAST